MSFLASFRASSRQAIRTNFAVPASSFHTSAVRSLKETDLNRDDLAEYLESQKEDLLRRSMEGKGQWKPELASESEEDVKADRNEWPGEQFDPLQKKKNVPGQN
ncbi:hypothetical protein N7475_009402 [Penicillium sp. IBT 31633x]|nr:hypothetical protein N7475_009402 [Penicillium sp. IBT 31633x]